MHDTKIWHKENCRKMKMQDWKMKHKKQDVKMQDWKMRHKKFMVGKCEASQYEKRTDTYKSNYYLLKTTG